MLLYKQSLPMRGEWIEILPIEAVWFPPISCLSPCGESGLKFERRMIMAEFTKSLPMRGEWIEITEEGSAS